MCMLAISKSSLEKRLFRRPAQFLIVFFLCWWMIHCFKYHTVQYTEVCQLSQKHLYICPESIIAPSFLLSNSFPLSWASLVVQLVRNPPAVWGTCVGKIPWRRERLPTPVFWPGEFHGRYSPWGRKESDMTEWLSCSLSSKLLLQRSAPFVYDTLTQLCLSRYCCLILTISYLKKEFLIFKY